MSILIKNGLLIDPQNNIDCKKDLLIEAGKVAAVEDPGVINEERAQKVIDVANCWVMPGLIDLHVHLREPGYEWKETIATGSKAAVLGGYTSICCMPNTSPVIDCQEVVEYIVDKAKSAGLAKVLPIGSVSKGLKGKEMAPFSELHKAGCVAFSDDGEPVFDAGLMRRALEWCLMLDVPISCHEEDKCLSCGGCMHESGLSMKLGLPGMPTIAEDVMVARDIELALYTGGRAHICHISSARGVELIRRAKNDGVRITCEVTPHHLLLLEDEVEKYDANYKMSPPLRDQEIQDALWEGLIDGTIDAIASDHAPHEADSKDMEFELASMGILGLQTSLPLMVEQVQKEKISRLRAVEVMTSGPAACFNLASGALSKGSVADITVVDPEKSWLFEASQNVSKSINSPFLNKELKGRVQHVFVDGQQVVEKGVCCK